METGRTLHWRYRKARRRIVRAFCSKLYRDSHGDTRRSIMVAGTARSGTTWVTELIASQISCRVLFEPFHAGLVEAFRQFHYFQYMRPDEQNRELQAYCQRVFTGDIRHRWIDREVEQIFPQYRVVKDIRANLFLKWLDNSFPEVPLLFVMRHPCAVVLSRMQLGWWTDKDIAPFLSQPKLVDDFLADKMEIISRARTTEEKHAVIWCVSNLVPIRQFGAQRLPVVFYENLCARPEEEVPRIFATIGHEYDPTVYTSAVRPSYTTVRTSAVVTGEDRLVQWKRRLSPEQISKILDVVDAFELGNIYGDSVTPLVAALPIAARASEHT
jgi:hypothetical protein